MSRVKGGAGGLKSKQQHTTSDFDVNFLSELRHSSAIHLTGSGLSTLAL